MLYEEPGPLLSRAGQLLSSGAADDQVVAQLRSIGIQLKRLGAMWPDLFLTLAEENLILVAARSEIAHHLRALGLEMQGAQAPDPDDPLLLYRHVLKQLNDTLPLLHEHRRHPSGAAALTCLREAIREAGRVQAVMVDKAWFA